MKFIEIEGNMLVVVSNEELLLVEQVKSSPEPVKKRELNERQQEIARNLVVKGVFNRFKIADQLVFTYNGLEDVRRD